MEKGRIEWEGMQLVKVRRKATMGLSDGSAGDEGRGTASAKLGANVIRRPAIHVVVSAGQWKCV